MSLPAVFSADRRRNFVALLTALVLSALALVSPSLTKSADAYPLNQHLSPATETSLAYLMLGALNNERRAHGEAPLYMDRRLVVSAWRHNMAMGGHDMMSHQVPGEAFFGNRISAAGYRWQAAGENIGWTGTNSLAGLYELEHQMYIERYPNDGHKQNILSRSYRQIGISVVYDVGHHRLWFTQDFGELM